MTEAFISALKKQLQGPLPGFDAQYEMAHVKREKVRPEDLNPADFRKSAVLLLLCKKGSDFVIPLTERQSYKGLHSGQISLPGGKFDDADITLEKTACRECFEEIGLKADSILGVLSPVFIPVSKFLVTPYVAVLNLEEINYKADESEVKNIFELSLMDLKNPDLVKETTVEPLQGLKLKTPYFDVQGNIVWGATAMILNEFKTLLQKINLP